MAEIVNLRRARKSKARNEREKVAEANRVHHGTPVSARKRADAERTITDRNLEQHRLEQDDKD